MAFATSNVRKSYFGDLNVLAGDWTGSDGDDEGTVTVEGVKVYLVEFTIQDATTPTQRVPVSTSTSNGLSTITVHNREAVSTGRFLIISA